jgi:diguanylate cyclase
MGGDEHDGLVDPSSAAAASFEQLARPLLVLVQRTTGVETSFVTEIDWADQRQDVVLALNSGALQIPQGSSVDWSSSMCRSAFLAGSTQITDAHAVPDGPVPGVRTFFAVPIVDGQRILGTVCGASRQVLHISQEQLEIVELVSDALAGGVRADIVWRGRTAQAEHAVLRANERVAALESVTEELEVLALTDPLTGLANRRGFNARWEEELARSGRHDEPIALLLLDVDRFKQVNDGHGHEAGDRTLVLLADVLRGASRSSDVAARLGGDEFALVVTHADAEPAMRIAERIRARFAEVAAADAVAATVTIGVSTSVGVPRRDLVITADQALYRGKHAGGDRVELADPPAAPRAADAALADQEIDLRRVLADGQGASPG